MNSGKHIYQSEMINFQSVQFTKARSIRCTQFYTLFSFPLRHSLSPGLSSRRLPHKFTGRGRPGVLRTDKPWSDRSAYHPLASSGPSPSTTNKALRSTPSAKVARSFLRTEDEKELPGQRSLEAGGLCPPFVFVHNRRSINDCGVNPVVNEPQPSSRKTDTLTIIIKSQLLKTRIKLWLGINHAVGDILLG